MRRNDSGYFRRCIEADLLDTFAYMEDHLLLYGLQDAPESRLGEVKVAHTTHFIKIVPLMARVRSKRAHRRRGKR